MSRERYKNTVIYKICCKDETVTDTYIGHTTNFDRRKLEHIQSCKLSPMKVYEYIRNHGGWDNWDMVILEKYTCKSLGHACRLEWIWWNRLDGSLNSHAPGTSYIKRDQRRHTDFDTYIHEMELACRVMN
jgi:hypothetical protein